MSLAGQAKQVFRIVDDVVDAVDEHPHAFAGSVS